MGVQDFSPGWEVPSVPGHYQATAARVAAAPVALAVPDPTRRNYRTLPATALLGTIGSRPTGVVGLHVHSNRTSG